MKLILKISTLLFSVFLIVLISSCADNSVGTSDKIAPTISAESPVTGSMITSGKTVISYSVADDQGVKYVDVYAFEMTTQSKVYEGRFTFVNGVKPTIYFILDSAKTVGKRIQYYLIASDMSGNTTQSTTIDSIYVARVLTAPEPPYIYSIQRFPNSRIINISWQDTSKSATTFEIWRKVGAGTYTTFQTLSAGYFNVNDYNVDTTKTYYYKMRSKNEIGYSEFSSEVNSGGSGGSGNIPAPSNLTLTILSSSSVGVSWKNNTTANYCRIERSDDGEASYYKVVDLPTTSTYYVDSYNLSLGAQYFYRIKVFSGNDSAWSKSESVTMPAIEITKPTNITAKIDSSTSTKKVHIAWKSTSNQFDYTQIERRTNATPYEVLGQVGYNTSKSYSFDDATALAGVGYYYRVVSVNEQYNVKSEYSDEVSISFTNSSGGSGGSLATPTNLSAVAMGSMKIAISWSNNATINYSRIQRRIDGGQFYNLVDLPSNQTYYEDTDKLINQSKYFYRVKIYYGSDSATTGEVSATTFAFDISTPANLSAVDSSTTSLKKIHLSWKEDSNLLEYTEIERKTASDLSYTLIARISGYQISNNYTYDDATVAVGVYYYYRVRAVNSSYGVRSPYSNEALVIVPVSKSAVSSRKKK